MSQIGTQVLYSTVTNTGVPPTNTATAFMVGLSDWGPSTTPVTIQSLAQTISTIGPRSSTNTTMYDSLDVFFREAAPNSPVYFSRVVGPGASAASLVLHDVNASASVLVNANYVGNYGNDIELAVANSGGSFVITLTDTYGNALATSPSLTSRAAAQAWAATSAYITIIPYANAAGLPATSAATNLANGTDDRAHATLTQWTSALTSFSGNLGPGQLLAPGVTNTTLNGIWTQIGAAAAATNRVGICDMDDAQSAATLVSDIGTTFNSLNVGALGFWAGNLSAPGVTPGTTRSIPPSPVIAALCTQADATGNPNIAAAGANYQLQYCTGPWSLVSGFNETYNGTDRNTLNSSGINAFANKYGVYENYGFVSSILSTTDVTYWQFNHLRLRMAIGAEAQVIAEAFDFSQLDGAGSDILSFNQDLSTMLGGFLAFGALFGTQPGTVGAAYSVDTGPTVNTAQSMQAGNLNANLYVRMSPFAQLVTITVSSVPITSNVPTSSSSSATGL